MQCAKTILKRLFRVYAHIYHQHFVQVVELSEEAHLNTSFKHFIFFVQEFNLIDKRELAPLQELIDSLTERDYQTYQNHPTSNTNSELTKQEQLQMQLEQLQLQHQQGQQNNHFNQQNNHQQISSQQMNSQLNNQSNENHMNNQKIKCQINVPGGQSNKQEFVESTSTTNSFNSVITTSINETNDLGKQEIANSLQYSSDSNSRASSSGNSSKLEHNALFLN